MSVLFSDSVIVQLSRVDCAACGITFAFTAEYEKQRRDDHQSFRCPNGHINYYPQSSEAEIARAERDRALRDAQWQRERAAHLEKNLESERHKVAAERGAKTKLKKKRDRVAHGVCPCCHRSFANVKRHMATKHPGFAKDEESK